MASTTRTQLENWLKTLDIKADKVLDVGGSCKPILERTKSWDVKEYRILDLKLEDVKREPDIIEDLNEPILCKSHSVGDIFALKEENKKYIEHFNIAFCLETMQYMWNPVMALQNMNRFLKKGGALYISLPFLYPHQNPEGYDYLRYTKWGVEKLLKEVGFDIEKLIPIIEDVEGLYGNKEKQSIKVYFAQQKMHFHKTFDGREHQAIGYMVKAIKT